MAAYRPGPSRDELNPDLAKRPIATRRESGVSHPQDVPDLKARCVASANFTRVDLDPRCHGDDVTIDVMTTYGAVTVSLVRVATSHRNWTRAVASHRVITRL
jgi:hypothetical protein